jgi:signal transduction histidine kinase
MRSLTVKVALACLAASLLGIGIVAAFTVFNTTRQFGSFVFDERRAAFDIYLQEYYATHGSWEGVMLPPPPANNPPEVRFGRGGLTLADADGRVVFAGQGHTVGQQLTPAELAEGQTIEVEGQVVGTLIPVPDAPGYGGPAGSAFLGRTNQALLWGAAGAALVALAIGWLLARALTRPLKALTRASHAIAQGDLQQRVDLRSHDELGELAAAFNRMSADLARVSQLRRQMTADIAHDLRTPLSMILAHTEALRDGVLPPSPETHTLLHDEALRLNRLVEDLRTLSLADAGELALSRRPTAPGALLERAVASQSVRAQQQQVAVQAEAQPDLPAVDSDPDRIVQVLGNLLDNALRYTPEGGQITCRVTRAAAPAAPVTFCVADSGPGIAGDDLPHVFERFYRADKSRQRDANGSGLGLAIARSIVEAHGGRIWAESQVGQGARFFVELPAVEAFK